VPTIANGFYHGGTEDFPLPTRNINLTPEMDLFVDSKIQSGQYANASEVLRAGLRALEEDEQENQVSYRPSARRFKLVSIAASPKAMSLVEFRLESATSRPNQGQCEEDLP
jgi:putative addiction module CopG family antidote